jgi:diacylglycerol O-acyltransferase
MPQLMPQLMPLTDSVFLLVESRERPMHVGGLTLFGLPAGADPDYVNNLYHRLLAQDDVRPLFRRRPGGPLSGLGQWAWTDDDQLDLEYHVRLSALPRPGRVRELFELTSRLHGSLLDRHRPLWEFHVIEGLEGGRFAAYSKIHHALLDGVAALRLMEATLSGDPNAGLRAPWSTGDTREPTPQTPESTTGNGALRALRSVAGAIGKLAEVAPAFATLARQVFSEQAATLPFQAPKSMFNVPITGARRFAAQSYSMQRIRAVSHATGATINDVTLAMCAGALRQYLIEHNALPDRPLITAVPVSLRGDEGDAGRGNAVGVILCNLATNLADPAQRLSTICDSMRRGKRIYSGLTPLQITAISALWMAPLALSPIPGVLQLTPPPFNILISNVPGPNRPLYWNGARLEGVYPLSIPYDGQALNITATSYDGHLEVGLTGCRRSVPSLQRILIHLETALTDLERAVAV